MDIRKTHPFLKITFVLSILFIGIQISSNAQVSTLYKFSTDTVGLLTAPLELPGQGMTMSGGTTLASGGPGSGTSDHVYPGVQIGFPFRFNGATYSTIGISSNGFAWFGNTAPAANEYNPISDNFGSAGVVSVFGASLEGRNYVPKSGSGPLVTPTSTINYQIIGSSPNQIFIVQWNNFGGKSLEDTSLNDTTQDYNDFRIDLYLVLYQCSNVVQGLINSNAYPWFAQGVVGVSGECGLRGATSTDYFNFGATCQPNPGFLGTAGGTDLVPNLAPSGSNSTLITMSTGTCVPGTVLASLDFTSPILFDILGGNPQAWNYTPKQAPFAITCSATTPVCPTNQSTVSINTETGGIFPFSADWTFTGGSPNQGIGSAPSITSVPYNNITTTFGTGASASYNVIVTDSTGCTASCSGNITVPTCTTNTIACGPMPIVGGPFCPCGTIVVPFTSTGTFNAGNSYTVQLSDSNGSFAAPINLFPSINSTANSGNMTVTIPCNTLGGSNYMVRVVSNNPTVTGTSNGVSLVINASGAPTISIFVNLTSICSGGAVHCTAIATNDVDSSFQWIVNGNPAGTDSTGFTTTLINPTANADTVLIKCVLTTNNACAGTIHDTSFAQIVTVNSTSPAGDTITASPGTSICPGMPVTFTATPVNPGPAPIYQWYVNGNATWINSPTFPDSSAVAGDSIYCVMSSSNFCANPSSGKSNVLVITTGAPVTPSVTVSVPQDTICVGTSVTFTAAAVNGGVTPTYQWEVNDSIVGTGATYTTSTLVDSTNIVTCIMTTSLGCASSPTASDSVSVAVVSAPSLLIYPTSIIMCTGTPAQMTVSGASTYIWTPAAGLSCINCANPTVNATVTGVYKVTGTIGTCSATDSVVVAVICPGNFVPTAFSPNGDGINDVLTVLGPPIGNFDIKIFNRWGEMVFESNDQNQGWDGTYKAEKAPVGTYVWELTGTDQSGGKVLVQGKNSGSITLIR